MQSVLFLLLCCFLTVESAEFDRLFQPQASYCSAVFKGLGDAGIALPHDISGGLINPALTYSSSRINSSEHGSILAGYGRDSIFNRHIIPAGISYATSDGALAGYYRYLSGEGDLKQHEITLNLSGQLFNKIDDQGQVDFGLNFRLENMTWKQRPPRKLISAQTSPGNWVSSELQDTGTTGYVKDTRLLLDVGFFQSEVWPHTDFALTLRNILGYSWTKENSDSIMSSDTLIVNTSMIQNIATTRYRYSDAIKKTKGWINGHRTLAAGIVFHTTLAGGSLRLNFPCDVEVIGIFDRKVKNHYVFHSGAEVQIGRYLFARLGYSRAPGIMFMTISDIENINIFTGGAGVVVNKFSLNFYISNESFGTSMCIFY